jgi:arginine decarboxylase
MIQREIIEKWTYKDSKELYGIRNWGRNYFNISEKGEASVLLPTENGTKEISIIDIVKGIQERGITPPLLIRFKDILEARIASINRSFTNAINDYGYNNHYRGVYPIKVNQQEEVIREITFSGRKFHHGLEAGSKAELIAALAYMHDPEAFIICNGYKDEEFIDLSLYALTMGLQVIIVIERPGELQLILKRASSLNIKPRLGVRVKLSSRGNGHWIESGGDRSVFGLTATQILRIVDRLKKDNLLDCLELLHYHVGSQIPNIIHVRAAVTEACRFYAELVKEGAKMGLFDIGGGLAVDYDGSQTNFQSSKNYTIEEYCSDILEVITSILNESKIKHPVIISESGRATVAYYSVLIFNILDINKLFYEAGITELKDGTTEHLKNLREVHDSLTVKNLQESYHDALFYRDEIRSMFLHGQVSLRERGIAEQIFWNILRRIVKEACKKKRIPEELQDLEKVLVDIYYGNFSLFQSIPDSWAIEQLFPIMPIHRLNEEPRNAAIIADITCDCDGKIGRFIDLHDVNSSLLLHDFREGEDYLIGVFMVGAYQETLGDLHNLFGDTNVVSVSLDENEVIEYTRELAGDSVSDVLSYVEYESKTLINNFRMMAENAVRLQKITPNERKIIMEAYENGLRGYTYYEK